MKLQNSTLDDRYSPDLETALALGSIITLEHISRDL